MAPSTTHRLLYDIPLRPVAGSRFQPTGFPDLGAAEFQRPSPSGDGLVPALLVESAQSMANRLEGVGWDIASQEPHPALVGLPYVRVVAADDGRYLTSSRTEAHRLASAFIKDAALDGTDMKQVIKERLGLRDDTPLAPRQIAAEVFSLDPLCLLHGVFFADKEWPGQPKIARAVTGFVEATGVQRAISGGVKRDAVRHSLSEGTGGTTEGYGTVPYHRVEYTADSIVASFVVDRAQIRSYGLPAPATELLEALARWEIRSLLDGGLRLRTACDLMPIDPHHRDQAGDPLPSVTDLEAEIAAAVEGAHELLGDGQPITVTWGGARKGRK